MTIGRIDINEKDLPKICGAVIQLEERSDEVESDIADIEAEIAGLGTGAITTVVVQKFTASGTYTPTASMKYCIIECVGGGGAGGASIGGASLFMCGGGGGSGGYSRKQATAADIGASKTVTIGGGGSGGAGDGSAGGSTSVGSLCIANGGGGALTAWPAVQQPSNGFGGVVAGGAGDLIAGGNAGGNGAYNNLNDQISTMTGNGGASVFGGAGRALFNTAGGAGTAPGAGGAGGACQTVSANGGNGAAGIVLITEFI